MQTADTIVIACQSHGQHGHTKGWTPAMILSRDLHELLAVESKLSPVGAKVLVDEIVTERIIPCRYRSVRREERICSNRFSSLVEAQAKDYQLPAAFQIQKGCMSLVKMPCSGRDA